MKGFNKNKKKGFTLIELTVVMAVLAVLVLLAAPKFLGHTKEAQFAKHINNAKVLEDASERYYIDHGKWPRGADDAVYTSEEVSAYAEKIYDITGEELVLEDGNYWDIDYSALEKYAKLPAEDERANYVLRNPVGTVYYLEGLTEEAEGRGVERGSEQFPEGYTLATDSDFEKVVYQYATNGYYWKYIGDDAFVIIPEKINGEVVTSAYRMFGNSASATIKGVASSHSHITDMSQMFAESTAPNLELAHLDTGNVTNMHGMFYRSSATTLDLKNFETTNVTNMITMFSQSAATTVDVSNFDTSKVTNMDSMFYRSLAVSLDLSSFDTTRVTNMANMFKDASTQSGYVRTQMDATRFNSSSNKPTGLSFSVKP